MPDDYDAPEPEPVHTPSSASNSQARSVSAPLAIIQPSNQGTNLNSRSTQNRSSGTPPENRKTPDEINNGVSQAPASSNQLVETGVATQQQQPGARYVISEESWKHHAQARAILSNLIGPNGEQLSSSDPYNTTVFVGGLSPLISEDTLRTFFVPFGEIHYVSLIHHTAFLVLTLSLGQGPGREELRLCSVYPKAGRRESD